MFYFSYNCCRSDMDREGKQRVCMTVVHAGCFIEFDAILMKPFISELLFATVHGVIIQLWFVGRMSVHSCLFSPKQPHHGCAWAMGSEALYVCSIHKEPVQGFRTKDRDADLCTTLPRQAARCCLHFPVTEMLLTLMEQAMGCNI